jgi:8-oxo-dGTP diphosphatase/2-hydroxy-dATP diphosphatase
MENKKVLTLCIVRQNGEVLLGMKKRGFGVGRWNGFGGKVEEGETIEGAAKRELKEESGLETVEISEKGIIDFEFENSSKVLEVHIFTVPRFIGDIKETEEMRPKWFDEKELPFNKMWTDDKYWMPLLLNDKKFKGKFLFDKPSDAEYSSKIISKELYEI